MHPNVTVVVCTRNRAASLRRTLAVIGRVRIPAGWHASLLVVDNGSTDETATIVREANLPNMPVSYASEPQPGLSGARNRAHAEAPGDILLFTDDDVFVPENWLEAMVTPIVRGTADAVAGGIRFPPDIAYFMSRPPLALLRGWFACSDYLDPKKPVNMIGANMAYHRRVLAKVSGYDLALGPGKLGFFEESLFSWQVEAAGFRLIGALDVTVEHHFDISRLTRASLIELARKMGRSHAYVFHHWEHQRSRGIRLRLLRAWLKLSWLRLLDRAGARTGDLPPIELIKTESTLAFCHEYLVQKEKPRAFPPRGRGASPHPAA